MTEPTPREQLLRNIESLGPDETLQHLIDAERGPATRAVANIERADRYYEGTVMEYVVVETKDGKVVILPPSEFEQMFTAADREAENRG